ncbi:hypothetical protein CCACVL1_00114 [Corchorus capsularis]|uniref:Uncharacterized protein n=1 Tax=Corchorus capsularis TaxID=210143 RepID=A0A1R3KYE5_COCAP|nr:hypothetical protein CCACVL1_00114 [Corchorus capsularis]
MKLKHAFGWLLVVAQPCSCSSPQSNSSLPLPLCTLCTAQQPSDLQLGDHLF